MSLPNCLEVVDELGQYRLVGPQGFHQAVRAVTEAVCTCREQGLRKMLIVSTEAVGFEPPSMVERHAMVRRWAEAAHGAVRIAMVVPPEFIDSEKFAVVAAANFGLASNVFNNEADALAWLQDPH